MFKDIWFCLCSLKTFKNQKSLNLLDTISIIDGKTDLEEAEIDLNKLLIKIKKQYYK